MTDYKFKEEFENKLGADKEAFIYNLFKADRQNIDAIRVLNRSVNFKQFVIGAFLWKYTKQGYDYWLNVSNR